MNTIFPDISKLSVIKNAFTKFVSSNLNDNEFLYSYAIFLEAITSKKFHSQQELSKFVGCNKAHTSRTLLKMKSIDLIKISDEVNCCFELTEKGKKYIIKYRKLKQNFEQQLIKNLHEKDIEHFVKIVEKICNNAKDVAT